VAGAQQQALLVQTGGTFVVANVQVRYLVSAKLDDLMMVTAKLVEQGQVSLQIEQQAWRGDTLLAQGRVRIAWVHASTLRPTRIPPLMLDALIRDK
jgi:acyl-CoA thioester hydrolase